MRPQPPEALRSPANEVDNEEELLRFARASGLIDDREDLDELEARALRSTGIEPRLAEGEGRFWQDLVGEMYALFGGSPADYGDEATAAIALHRASETLDFALGFFGEDHPLREHVEAARDTLWAVETAHFVYIGSDEWDQLDLAMRRQLVSPSSAATSPTDTLSVDRGDITNDEQGGTSA